MHIVIDTMQCPYRTLNDECNISLNECYEDDICSTCPLIRNGGVKLPTGHGRLIDADALLKKHPEFDTYPFPSTTIDNAPPIIEADKAGSEE